MRTINQLPPVYGKPVGVVMHNNSAIIITDQGFLLRIDGDPVKGAPTPLQVVHFTVPE